ncbi:SAV_6107 family HEPN domain-containing protein [Streptomyces gamaensis]|uniref:SAV_6107 family HEPN domain-containing protein n=1 Tax=Streptomyces gamaensis TaxID=1763542 RepID=A0ABW0Z5T1_9ACTN
MATGASDVHPSVTPGDRPAPARPAPVPSAALDLLTQARTGLAEAARLQAPHERYATAHLAALRTAAAVLAVRCRPQSAKGRRRIRSAWALLPEVAPELAEWSALFASGAQRRARAEAGIRSAASPREADDLLRDAEAFWRLVERTLVARPRLPEPHPREAAG